MSSSPLFHRAHYNIIAKQLRTMAEELTGTDSPGENAMAFLASVTLQEVTIRLARRFEQDNPNFEPVLFIHASIPRIDKSEALHLWEDLNDV